jgi:phosphatidylglycerophosphate synthase
VIPDREAYFRRWAALHGGYDPATGGRLVRWWLSVAHALASPLARAGVAPGAVTAFAVALAYVVPAAALAGGRWALLAGALAAGSALADGLDGAVAVLRDRTTRWGYVVDSVADRAADAAYLLALWWLGAPGGLCVAAGAGVALLEYGRARAGNAGLAEIGVVTVGERPTRVIVTVAFLLAAGALPGHAALLAGLGAAATLGVTLIGAAQLAVVARRALR